jgi:hypothetical protein
MVKAKVKVKFTLAQATKARVGGGLEANLYSFFNLGAREGGWSTPRPGRLTPRKDPVPINRRLGGPQGRSGWVRKISPPPGFDPRTVQPVASRYTDCAIPTPTKYYDDDQIKEVWMGRTRGTHGKEEKSYTIFAGKPERKRMFGSYRLIWRTTSNRKFMKLDGSLSTEFIWL